MIDMPTVRVPEFLDEVRPTTWRVLALAIVAIVGSLLLSNYVLFQGRVGEVLTGLKSETSGWVSSTLVAGLLTLAIFAVVVLGIGRLRPSDVGWNARSAGVGLLVTLGFWIAMQGALLLIAALRGEAVALHQAWTSRGVGFVLGGLLAQLLGNALTEEVQFRGFLLPQLYRQATGRYRRGVALAIALVGTHVLFALSHIPNHVFVKQMTAAEIVADQFALFFAGLFLATIYLVTRNLFVAIGIHSLSNEQVPLVQASENMTGVVWFGLTLILIVAWPFARKFRRDGWN